MMPNDFNYGFLRGRAKALILSGYGPDRAVGLPTAVTGLAIGLSLSFFALHILRSGIYGVHVYDPLTLMGTPLLLALIGLIATWLPALRIARIDPVRTLHREE
jgi:ABC-type antimicrobial peptide transport system permease subunit